MTSPAMIRRTETRNLMLTLAELADAKRTGDAQAAGWALDDLAVLARLAGTQRVQSRAIAELCRLGFWNNCQPEPGHAPAGV